MSTETTLTIGRRETAALPLLPVFSIAAIPPASDWNPEQPPMGLFKTEGGFLFMADVLDRRQEDFSVRFEGGLFTIREEPPADIWEGDWTFSDFDGPRRGFRKEFRISTRIREEGMQICYRDGFLIVWLPLAPEICP